MIQFHAIPTVEGRRLSYEDVYAIKLAEQLNAGSVPISCVDHAEANSLVRVGVSPRIRLQVTQSCCRDFQQKLQDYLDKACLD